MSNPDKPDDISTPAPVTPPNRMHIEALIREVQETRPATDVAPPPQTEAVHPAGDIHTDHYAQPSVTLRQPPRELPFVDAAKYTLSIMDICRSPESEKRPDFVENIAATLEEKDWDLALDKRILPDLLGEFVQAALTASQAALADETLPDTLRTKIETAALSSDLARELTVNATPAIKVKDPSLISMFRMIRDTPDDLAVKTFEQNCDADMKYLLSKAPAGNPSIQ